MLSANFLGQCLWMPQISIYPAALLHSGCVVRCDDVDCLGKYTLRPQPILHCGLTTTVIIIRTWLGRTSRYVKDYARGFNWWITLSPWFALALIFGVACLHLPSFRCHSLQHFANKFTNLRIYQLRKEMAASDEDRKRLDFEEEISWILWQN